MSTTLRCPVRAQVAVQPNAPALMTPDGAWSWTVLDRHVSAWAGYLNTLAPDGGRVAVRAETSPRMVALVLAALRTGHVLAPCSARLPEGALHDLLTKIGRPPLVDLDESPAPHSESSLPSLSLDRPGTIVFTSGSTGTPKAALHTVGNHIWSARGWIERLNLGPSDRWLLDLPLHHVGGLAVVYRCALAGATLAVPTPKTPVQVAIHRLGVTHASLVATQLHRMLQRSEPLPRTVRVLLLGGSAIPDGLLDEAHARGWPILVSYGLTEMASTVTATPPNASREDLATAGTALPYRSVSIQDGQVLVGGPTRFAGYVDGDQLTTPFSPDGWFATGDLGHVDAHGRLHITGRRDNLFISGGENIQPESIEAVLVQQPGVIRAIVVPVPSAEFGQRPVAFLDVSDRASLDPGRLRAALQGTLPRFMIPEAFYPWPEGDDGLKPSRPVLAALATRYHEEGPSV